MSRPDQLQRIHVLKASLGLSDDDYRTMMASMFEGVTSSKDLDNTQADQFIAKMRSLLPKKTYSGRRKYEDVGSRPGMASPAQMRMVEAMWADVSVFRDPHRRAAALREFLSSRFGINDVLWMQYTDVRRIVSAIKAMRRQNLAAAANKMLGGKP